MAQRISQETIANIAGTFNSTIKNARSAVDNLFIDINDHVIAALLQEDEDYAYALQLQQEEDYAYALQLQQEENDYAFALKLQAESILECGLFY